MNLRPAIGCVCSALVVCVGVQALSASPPPAVSWATQAGGTGGAQSSAISALPDGSSIVTGYFTGTATFGSTTLPSSGNTCGTAPYTHPCNEMFTAKMNADGTWGWANAVGGNGNNLGAAVSALPDGSSIVTGYLQGTATFGITTLTRSPDSYQDVFVAKMNTDGTWAWATSAGGVGDGSSGSGISALPDGSSLVFGSFSGTATFGSTTLASGGSSVFIAKMNADGTWGWATKAHGTGLLDASAISALPDGSSIVTGFFGDTATFGRTTLTGEDKYDVFVAKMNADGTWAWANKAGGEGYGAYGAGISTLPDGSSIVTGSFQGTVAFGRTTLTTNGRYFDDLFVAKMNANGTWAWATQAKGGNSGSDGGSGIATLPDGSSIVTGRFDDTATFGTTTLTSAGSNNEIFTAKVNADGTWAWATQSGGTGDDVGYGVSTLPDGSFVTTGQFQNTASFGNTTLTSAGSNDIFVARYLTTPQATAAITGKTRCVATTCVTTGSVPPRATRITQRATTRPAGRTAPGKCTIRRASTRRTYSCTVHVTAGTWVITTTSRRQSMALAHFSKRVRVARQTAPDTE